MNMDEKEENQGKFSRKFYVFFEQKLIKKHCQFLELYHVVREKSTHRFFSLFYSITFFTKLLSSLPFLLSFFRRFMIEKVQKSYIYLNVFCF